MREPFGKVISGESQRGTRRRNLTICDDGNAAIKDAGPRGEDVADVTLILDRDIQTFGSPPNVGVVDAGLPNLGRV